MDDFVQLLTEGDEAYKKNGFSKANVNYEDAFKIATNEHKNKLKTVLPMTGCCYRRINSSSNVINLAFEVKEKFGRDIITSAFLTNIVATYADLREITNACGCIKAACDMENGEISTPFQTVIGRLT